MRCALLVCFALLLSGCSASPDAPPPAPAPLPDPAPEEPEPEPGPAEPEEPAPPRPQDPPRLALAVSAVNGTAPLTVNVTINGTDPDGDRLIWSLLVNGTLHDEGLVLPVSLEFTFGVGHHNLTAHLNDGNATVTDSVYVAVDAPLQRLEQPISGKSAACLPNAPYDATGMGYVEVPVDPTTVGHPFFVHFAGHSAFDLFLILDSEGEELERALVGVNELGPDHVDMPTWTHAGTVPEAAHVLVFVSCDNLNNSKPVEPQAERFRYIAGPDAVADPLR